MNILYKLRMPFKYYNYKTKKRVVRTYPDRIYIETTNACNLNCIMCPTGLKLMERRKGYMAFEKFKGIIDEMAQNVRATTLHIWGEPLLHPHLFEIIQYCKRYPIKVEISSNATLLTEEKAKSLLKTGLDVLYLCMDGACKETYEKIRRKADFEETKANIRRFLELKTKSGLRKPSDTGS